ncbi:AprI/Inh family metalloprotease inhibitor [Kaistia dalseonensis]|uniref:Alkaline proteinase inhibitor/ Outer membrane lipoprotein Omp19 domain-containing protein n=1 Tax=Kaistia dalseonensis TaxID=410840 RepID=A0ABU0H5W9_9HYPH|nr:AprI/Inh family metalloprotease inhibitor [Kaistia dalseonensis]MCX5494323.1 AprI/Inh family metalloprotease inhibitor [Kaistia dalseonensis]MDQ0436904.1 hypothetical protein [Kaistia dalseonensis]
MRLSRLAPMALALALAGCGSFGAVGLGPMEQSRPPESDTLPPVASAPIEKTTLPPPPGVTATTAPNSAPLPPTTDANGQPLPGTPTAPGATTTAAAPPVSTGPSTASGAELGRTDLLGGWTLTSGSESCQLFMTLTSWTGGYRASTRGCQSPTLKSISAWSLSGSNVVLSGNGGAPVANLSSAGGNRFNGQTTSSQPVSFYR